MFLRNLVCRLPGATPRAMNFVTAAVQASKTQRPIATATAHLRFFAKLPRTPRPDDMVPSDLSFKQVTPVSNPHLSELPMDYLYHLGLSTEDDLEGLFSDVKFLCVGGSADRIEHFANRTLTALGPKGANLLDIPNYIQKVHPLGKTERFSLFKVGPVLMCSHGMGQPSCSILLHEITKLLNYAGAKDVEYFRMGTSGGVGVEPGTVVITTGAVNGMLEPFYELPILGKRVARPAVFDEELVRTMVELEPHTQFPVVAGKTMACDCFYEGQGRLDGAICDYTDEDKHAFLRKAHELGVRNIEMEAAEFGAFTHRLGIRATDVCVALLDRLKGDQVSLSPESLQEFGERPATVVLEHITMTLEKARSFVPSE